MKLIIAGSRTITNYRLLKEAIQESGFTDVEEVVSGNARGADWLGERWARSNDVPLTIMPADWDKYGKRAGYLRNVEMAHYVGPGGALIALWDGESKGTLHMISIAREFGLQVYVKECRLARV